MVLTVFDKDFTRLRLKTPAIMAKNKATYRHTRTPYICIHFYFPLFQVFTKFVCLFHEFGSLYGTSR